MNCEDKKVRLKSEDLLKVCGKEMSFKQTSDLSNASVENYSTTGFLISSRKCRARQRIGLSYSTVLKCVPKNSNANGEKLILRILLPQHL